jgi:hypothetical protein
MKTFKKKSPGNMLAALIFFILIHIYCLSESKAQIPSTKPATENQPTGTPADQSKGPGGSSVSDRLKNSWPWLSLGADFRFRWEYQFDVFTLNSGLPEHEYSYQRYRMRVWTKIHPVEQLDFNVRLTSEPRTYLKPDRMSGCVSDEFIFDSLNMVWRKVANQPMTLTVGRQEIILGNGWLVLEGTPLDGSRTLFFDAARMTYTLASRKTTFDLIGISQSAASNRWVPPLYDQHKSLLEQNENGAIFYVTNKALPRTQIDGYFIYKHDTRVLLRGDMGDIYAFGGRIEGNINNHWKYRAEFAPEMGNKNGQDLKAFGSNNRLSYNLKNRTNQSVRFGYEYLSGDDPGTKGRDEGFDPLWGRWPQWSELLLYNFATETRVGYWTNLHRMDFGWSCNPTNRMELNADYMPLFAASNPFQDRPGFSQSGKSRGNFASALVRYKFNEHLSGHLLGELFFPGDYYSSLKQDPATFLRAEFIVAW